MQSLLAAFREIPLSDAAALAALGVTFAAQTEKYRLTDETRGLIRRLSQVKDRASAVMIDTELSCLEEKRIRRLAREREAYSAFADRFDETVRRGLLQMAGIPEPGSVRFFMDRKGLHVLSFYSPAMQIALDFEGALVEDGRRPQKAQIIHIEGEEAFREEKIPGEDGKMVLTRRPVYRLRYIDGSEEGGWPSREHVFSFTGVSGRVVFSNYARFALPPDLPAPFGPWRIFAFQTGALIERILAFGLDPDNPREAEALPVLSLFYDLTGLLTDPGTDCGFGRSGAVYDPACVSDLVFDEVRTSAACAFLEEAGLPVVLKRLETAGEDRDLFFRWWIRYAAMSQSEDLYNALLSLLDAVGSFYRHRIFPEAYYKNHASLNETVTEVCRHRGLSGDYPHFYRLVSPRKTEVSEVYHSMYTYVNEKRKAYYFDFFESVDEEGYHLVLLTGQILMRDGMRPEQAGAVSTFFMDGGRRRPGNMRRQLIGDRMSREQLGAAAASLVDAAIAEE